jgi:hypothetical protein
MVIKVDSCLTREVERGILVVQRLKNIPMSLPMSPQGIYWIVCDRLEMYAENVVGIFFQKASDILDATKFGVENLLVHPETTLNP